MCAPAGMTDTSFLRSDELPGRAALGYLEDEGLRTNVFYLPVRGNGDGGIYTTAADVHALWMRCSQGGSCLPRSSPRWCARAVTCRRTRRATGSASGSTSRPAQYRSTVSMRARVRLRPRCRCTVHLHRPVQQGARGVAGRSTPRRDGRSVDAPSQAPDIVCPDHPGHHPRQFAASLLRSDVGAARHCRGRYYAAKPGRCRLVKPVTMS